MNTPAQPDPIAEPTDETPKPEYQFTAPELLAFAMRMHRENRLDAAEKCYRTLLEMEPSNANATHFLGVLLQQRGEATEALKLIRKSISLDPMVASWHNNIGNLLLADEKFEEAATAYARCSELDPENLEVLNNLGALLRAMGRFDEAEKPLMQAITRKPEFVQPRLNLAAVRMSQQRVTEAYSLYADALALEPENRRAWRLLAWAYGRAGRLAEGRTVLQECLKEHPDDPQAQHLLASLGGGEVPDRASDRYIEDEFDGFAASFDVKLAALEYRAPQLVGEVVARVLGAPTPRWQVLDIGCGTGLCAPWLRPYASRLAGVDLSARMLDRARARGQYDELVKSELVAFLRASDLVQDVVVSADTLVYFGALDAAFAAVQRSLRAGGHFIFSLEAHVDADDFRLHPHGRYSHSRGYVEAALTRAGFGSVEMAEVVLRSESGKPVDGWLVCAVR